MKAINKVLYDANSKKFYANVLGNMIEIAGGGKNGSGVTVVDTLPDTGEEGKIYYNKYDHSYYTYNDEFEKIGKDSIDVIVDVDDVPRISPSDPADRNSYLLTPNVFYNIGDWNRSHTPGEDAYMVFALNRNYEGIYAGKFIAWADDLNISWPSTVVIPDNVPDIINGHQYEFNIWQDVLILVDVTSTEQGGE